MTPQVGQTVDAIIGHTRERVTLIDGRTLRVEPSTLCTILTRMSQNGETTFGAVVKNPKP
jgi:hypothetical protein